MKNICNFDLTYDFFLLKNKFTSYKPIFGERERERERESFDISKNIQVNLIKIEHN